MLIFIFHFPLFVPLSLFISRPFMKKHFYHHAYNLSIDVYISVQPVRGIRKLQLLLTHDVNTVSEVRL
jgi:hypothetical protein